MGRQSLTGFMQYEQSKEGKYMYYKIRVKQI
jgi:hypothetical protein